MKFRNLTKKVLFIIIMLITILISNSKNTFAYKYDETSLEEDIIVELSPKIALEDPIDNPGGWKPIISTDETELKEKAGKILGIINVIGIVLSVIALTLIGMKYMLGSVEERAEYKKAIIPYIIGILFLVGATTLPNIIYNITNTIL